MKALFTTLCILISTLSFGQDTTDIYVINKTNRLVSVGTSSYSFVYRDLKSLKQIKSFHFETLVDLEKFFGLCQKALEKDQGTVTEKYNVSRNRLSKNVVRVNDKTGGYVLLKYSTLEHMKKAVGQPE
jgi:hypothetical protein